MYQLGDLIKTKAIGHRFEVNEQIFISFKEGGVEVKFNDSFVTIPYETSSKRNV